MPTKSIIFNCEIITPMFIGNAIPGQAELRPTAIKGALRFWWRAMNGAMPLDILLEEEAKIFGSAYEEVGRSKVQIEIEANLLSSNTVFNPNPTLSRKILKVQRPTRPVSKIKILEFLGYGVIDGNEEYKYYFSPPQKFIIKILFDDTKITEDIINKCFYLISTFGGLGSKARNGFGRLNITELSTIKATDLLKELKNNLKSSFTSFSNDISLYSSGRSKANWNEVLSELGQAYLSSRVNYHDGSNTTANGIEDEHDYKLRPFIAAPLLERGNTHLPKYNGTPVIKLQRHSKTHFFGIVKNGSSYMGYILHLPYQYLAGSESELNITTANVTTLQTSYNTANNAFNNNLDKNGLKQIIL